MLVKTAGNGVAFTIHGNCGAQTGASALPAFIREAAQEEITSPTLTNFAEMNGTKLIASRGQSELAIKG